MNEIKLKIIELIKNNLQFFGFDFDYQNEFDYQNQNEFYYQNQNEVIIDSYFCDIFYDNNKPDKMIPFDVFYVKNESQIVSKKIEKVSYLYFTCKLLRKDSFDNMIGEPINNLKYFNEHLTVNNFDVYVSSNYNEIHDLSINKIIDKKSLIKFHNYLAYIFIYNGGIANILPETDEINIDTSVIKFNNKNITIKLKSVNEQFIYLPLAYIIPNDENGDVILGLDDEEHLTIHIGGINNTSTETDNMINSKFPTIKFNNKNVKVKLNSNNNQFIHLPISYAVSNNENDEVILGLDDKEYITIHK